jgi:hypothetical protein
MQAHFSGCPACQEELSLMLEIQGQISSVLQRRAAQAVPSQDAWERLEARLARAVPPAPTSFKTWLSRLAPGVGRISTHPFLGGVTMRKKVVLSGLAFVLVIMLVVILTARTATPVSAKDILDHAYAVQAADTPTQGIDHFRSEMYTNLQGLPEDQGYETSVESYQDLLSGHYRVVTLDNKTGKVVGVYAFDGTYTYRTGDQGSAQIVDSQSGLLSVYRSPQDASQGTGLKPVRVDPFGPKDIFDQMRSDPSVQLAGLETWPDGRTVYVLRSQQQIKIQVDGETQRPDGLVMVYFDSTSYEILGNRVTMEKEGREILISSQIVLADEILPSGSAVAWDLSDLHGIAIVDDPEPENGNQPLEPNSAP